MTGGLIQIVAYGSQDLFLTGIPEITFFKYIYKRYTNFAEETIDIKHDGIANFGEEITFTFPKNGDVVKSMFVKVNLPSVSLYKGINTDLLKEKEIELNKISENFSNFNLYIDFLYEAIKIYNKLVKQSNMTFTSIKNIIDDNIDNDKVNYYKSKLRLDPNDIKLIDFNHDLYLIHNTNNNEEEKINKLKINMKKYLNETIVINKKLQNELILKTKEFNSLKNSNYNFSWINNLGYKIVESVDLEIGGNIIDKQYGKWLYIWNELAENSFKKDTIDKIIGNIPELNNYNKNTKNAYSLYIPLKFWFNKDYGSSLPLISMRFQDIVLKIKIASLKNCIYTDYNDENNDLIDKIKLENITLLCDYIYLDNDERKKFSQASHEYLIEQTKNNIFFLKKSKEINIDLDFYHPIKYLIWTIQKSSNINKNLFFDFDDMNFTDNNNFFSANKNSLKTPLDKCRIELNGINRIQYLDSLYFNYLLPYECFRNTPKEGIYCYSFALNPLELQPSGTCNFSKLNKKSLNIILSQEFYDNIDDNDTLEVNVYAVNYNVLRFSKGLSGLGFNY